MKANELRIGNIINIHREFPDVWQNGISISENDMMCILDGSTWEPIPLSEEWLIKFGFKKQPDYIKHGNGQDWQPEYPQTLYKDYVKRLQDSDYSFYIRYESMSDKTKEDEIIEDDNPSAAIHLGEYYNAMNGHGPSYDYIFVRKSVEYVHQLQNLYFCLTGEELALK